MDLKDKLNIVEMMLEAYLEQLARSGRRLDDVEANPYELLEVSELNTVLLWYQDVASQQEYGHVFGEVNILIGLVQQALGKKALALGDKLSKEFRQELEAGTAVPIPVTVKVLSTCRTCGQEYEVKEKGKFGKCEACQGKARE